MAITTKIYIQKRAKKFLQASNLKTKITHLMFIFVIYYITFCLYLLQFLEFTWISVIIENAEGTIETFQYLSYNDCRKSKQIQMTPTNMSFKIFF